MKKIICLVVAVLMVVALFAACSTEEAQQAAEDVTEAAEQAVEEATEAAEPATDAEEPVAASDTKVYSLDEIKVGFAGVIDAEMSANWRRPIEWACDGAGVELVEDYHDLTPEAQVTSVENLISSGANIIIIANWCGEASIPQIASYCEEKGVYLVMFDTNIVDQDIAKALDENPYYVGFSQEDQFNNGYICGKELFATGVKHAIVYKYAVGVATCDDRVEGFTKAAEEAGATIDVVLEAPEDRKKAMADALIANPEADCLFVAGGGTYTSEFTSAASDAGRDIKLVCIDFFDGMGDLFDSGDMILCLGGHCASNYFVTIMGLNAALGTPLADDQYSLDIPEFEIRASQDYADYQAIVENYTGDPPYNAEDTQNLLKVNNPDLTVDSLQQYINDTWSLDALKAK